jgi:hypothetical protein
VAEAWNSGIVHDDFPLVNTCGYTETELHKGHQLECIAKEPSAAAIIALMRSSESSGIS